MICHSGGCAGADMEWEKECKKYNIKTISYSFHNHVQDGENPVILTQEELREGFEQVKLVSKINHRPVDQLYPYVKNLLARNWFQVKNSDIVLAIGSFQTREKRLVNGGTGWAVEMGILSNKPVYVFDQVSNEWHQYMGDKFYVLDEVPQLTENFAGIGTREITPEGIQAIQTVLRTNLH